MSSRIVGLVCAAVVLVPASAAAQLRAVTYVTGLNSPIAFVQDPGNASVQYVVQQGGRIRVVSSGVLQATDFLDLSSEISTGGERGLLGLAFPADYASSGRFYVNFTRAADGHTVVARFRRSASSPLVADPATRLDLLWSTGERFIQQPFANHNGGNLAFGPDGFLYVGMGDGGSGNDPQNHAQRADSLLGKMLRIDVSVPDSNTSGFVVPADNPFVTSSRPEIWSFGLRNPWRWSFDDPARGGTGALVIADVGQGAFEEVNYEPAGRGGRNYGWRIREGAHDTGIATTPAFLPLTDPIHEYGRSSGASITGGVVYRGTGLSANYRGRYFFGDFISGRIWSLALAVNSTTGEATSSDLVEHTSELSSGSVSTFGVDASGELYFVNYSSGQILRIAPAGPVMTLDKTALTFGAVNIGSAFTGQTRTQSVRLTQSGTGTVTWTASSSAPWLVVSPASGSGTRTLNVSVQFAPGLAATQTGTVTIAFTGASSASAAIQVTLNTFTTTSSTAPSGSFDTPDDGATGLTGSIAVTGWAVDDIEVNRVAIYRGAVAGEPADALVFLGNATLVDGARPDVQATFPTAPHSSRLGWGYLLLTNFLPGGGDGTYQLHAFAEDVDQHTTFLGVKTITATNSTATTPFGAIDTPDQGGIVSGNVTNFGWVLARGPRRADPPGGGTVQVVIDGAIASMVPGSWTSREDLTALFPASEYPGIGTALGVAGFDSTALANGVHTIAWLVTDNLGNAAGIGSRYFTVSNGSSLTMGGTAEAVPYTSMNVGQHSALIGRRGFDPFGAFEVFTPGADGRVVIRIPELGRIELWVEPGGSGYAVAAGARQALPIGSQLDAGRGRFTWNPGAGFVGAYDLVLNGRAVRIVVGRD